MPMGQPCWKNLGQVAENLRKTRENTRKARKTQKKPGKLEDSQTFVVGIRLEWNMGCFQSVDSFLRYLCVLTLLIVSCYFWYKMYSEDRNFPVEC